MKSIMTYFISEVPVLFVEQFDSDLLELASQWITKNKVEN
jgi:hypothetical protein